jgi:hypothetical protein
VIERYVDPGYRFSGLLSFAFYLLQQRAVQTRQDSRTKWGYDSASS